LKIIALIAIIIIIDNQLGAIAFVEKMDANSLTITPTEFDENIQRALDDFDSTLNIAQKTRSPSPDEAPPTPDVSKGSPKLPLSPMRQLPGTPLGTSSPQIETDASSASLLLSTQNERDRELLHDFDLQMAIALSLSESEAKTQQEEETWDIKT
jgi:hypothetical protein